MPTEMDCYAVMDVVLGGAVVFVTEDIWPVSAGDYVQEIHSTDSELRHQMRRET